MNNQQLNRAMPIVILLLVAALVASVAALTLHRAGSKNNVEQVLTQNNQQVFKWTLVTTWPKNFPGLGTSPERLAQWVNEMSDGRLQIEVFGAGEIVPAMQVFDAVSEGTAEMGHGAAYYWKGKLAVSPFFTAVPFGLTGQEMNGWLHHGGGLELWRRAYAPFGIYPLAGGNTGVQMAGWFNREINSMEDISGLKMRIPGLAGEVFTQAGGTSVSMPGGELFTSLQTGVIDAAEWVGPYNDLAFGLHKAAKYYYYPGWHEPGPTLEVIINQDAWDSLPEDLQHILTVAARAVNQDMLDEYTALNNRALTDLVDNHGVQLRKLPDDVLLQLKRIAGEVLLKTSEDSPLAKEIYDSFTEYQKGVINYHHISEQAYLDARDLE